MQKYSILVIDPPWPQKKGGLRKARPLQSKRLDYNTLSIKDIFILLDQKIFPMTDTPCCIFIWAIDKFLFECEYEMECRKYKRHARLIWNKITGIAPAFTIRYAHEYLIWFYKPTLLPVNRSVRGKFSTIIEERSREHSRKPDTAYNILHQMYPAYYKIDVFSREKRKHFDQWGDQIEYFNLQRF